MKVVTYFTDKLKSLRSIWLFSDSQPTEITLALANLVLVPLATFVELGPLYLYQGFVILAALYQLHCISEGDLDCRIRASFITFGTYFTTLLIYLSMIGLPTPSHWGWLVLLLSAFGSLRRLIKEKYRV